MEGRPRRGNQVATALVGRFWGSLLAYVVLALPTYQTIKDARSYISALRAACWRTPGVTPRLSVEFARRMIRNSSAVGSKNESISSKPAAVLFRNHAPRELHRKPRVHSPGVPSSGRPHDAGNIAPGVID